MLKIIATEGRKRNEWELLKTDRLLAGEFCHPAVERLHERVLRVVDVRRHRRRNDIIGCSVFAGLDFELDVG